MRRRPSVNHGDLFYSAFMTRERTLVQLSERGQITLPADVRKALGLEGGETLRLYVKDGRFLLEPIEAAPVNSYTAARIEEFHESAEMTEDELAAARAAWGL